MLAEVRRVWVIQEKSSGLFITPDLFFTNSLRHAGRCYDVQSAHETGRLNCGDDYEVFSFYELDEESRSLF